MMAQWNEESLFEAWMCSNKISPAEWQEWDGGTKRLMRREFARGMGMRPPQPAPSPRVNLRALLLWALLVAIGLIIANDIARRL